MVRLSTRVCAGLRIRVELHVTMAEEVAPAAAPAPKAPKKKSRKAAPSGPSAGELILKAVKASSQRKGLSYIALKRELAAAGYDVEHRGVHIKRAVKKLQVDGFLVQLTGAGASGSFRASKPVHKPRKVAPKPAKKKPASRAKKPASPVKKGGVASRTKSPSAPAKKKKEEEGPKAPAARKVTKKVTKKKVAPPRKSPKKPLAVKAKPTSSRRTAQRK
nr:PREDICTED: histone H1-like [Paralichthys olivaceus]